MLIFTSGISIDLTSEIWLDINIFSNCSTAVWLSHLFSEGWTISWPGSVLLALSLDWTSHWATALRCPLQTEAPLVPTCSALPVCLRLHWPRGCEEDTCDPAEGLKGPKEGSKDLLAMLEHSRHQVFQSIPELACEINVLINCTKIIYSCATIKNLWVQ